VGDGGENMDYKDFVDIFLGREFKREEKGEDYVK